jgi:hypothetical protein
MSSLMDQLFYPIPVINDTVSEFDVLCFFGFLIMRDQATGKNNCPIISDFPDIAPGASWLAWSNAADQQCGTTGAAACAQCRAGTYSITAGVWAFGGDESWRWMWRARGVGGYHGILAQLACCTAGRER